MLTRPGATSFIAPDDPRVSMPLMRWLLGAAAASLILRLWIAIVFPITGDEAFFYWWGVYPDWGYYDHPPMVGWLIGLMRWAIADTTWAIRIPVVLLPLALGAMLWWALHPLNRVRAAWAVLFFWLAPINWLNSLITTDTPLIFWSVLSVACLFRAEQRQAMDRATLGLYTASGLFLACAFLSKYFSVVLGLTYLVYFVAFRRERLSGFVWLVICALPGPLTNFGWNMSHGWPNIMFNVYNRNADAAFSWSKPLIYIGMMLYLMTPMVAWLGWTQRRDLVAMIHKNRLISTLVLVPLLFFLILSLKKTIGLHWVLSFYPFGFVLLAFALPARKLSACALGMAAFTALHVMLVVGVSASSLEQWKDSRIYASIIRSYKTQELLSQVTAPDVVIMSDAYTPASIYGFTLRQYVPVFGVGKFHARQDDMLVDFSLYQGKTLRIMLSDFPNPDDFRPYFSSVTVLTLVQNGVTFYAIEGKDFDYPAYKAGPLSTIYQKYYNIPTWLPMTGCPFCQRFCGQVRCTKP